MQKVWFIFYNICFIPLFWIALRFISLFNKKVRTGLKERKSSIDKLINDLKNTDKNKTNILIHCSSLGEFEEAKPLIEELDKRQLYNFIISFYSPSGYKNSKIDFELKSAIIKTYLPIDTINNITKFVDIINPVTAVFIKYELWYNILSYLKKQNIFSILVNASFNTKAIKWKIGLTRIFYKNVLCNFSVIVTRDKIAYHNFLNLFGTSVPLYNLGDTKIERIIQAKDHIKDKNLIEEKIYKDKNIFVIGSSWDDDDDLLLPVLNKLNCTSQRQLNNLITFIAPHEPDEDTLNEIEVKIKTKYSNLKAIKYSKLKQYTDENVVIVDCIGILLGLYKYANIAYVGGGFQNGLHNVLEPAGFGIPVLFGNNKLSDDAEMLIKTGGGIPVGNIKELYRLLVSLLTRKELRENVGRMSYSVFDIKNHTSEKIAELIPT